MAGHAVRDLATPRRLELAQRVLGKPGWYDSIGQGSIGTSHMDMVCLVPDERVIVLAPHLVNYGFVRWRDRPEVLRRGLVARLPPAAWSPEDGSPPA